MDPSSPGDPGFCRECLSFKGYGGRLAQAGLAFDTPKEGPEPFLFQDPLSCRACVWFDKEWYQCLVHELSGHQEVEGMDWHGQLCYNNKRFEYLERSEATSWG